MNGFYEFKDLKVGMRVNVEGRYDGNGSLRAMQMEIKSDGEMDEMEGRIESVDEENESLTMFGATFDIDEYTIMVDMDKDDIDVEDLEPGMRIKTKGRMSPDRRFTPEKIKVKMTAPDSLDEIEGKIDAINAEERTVRLLGFTVQVGDDVEIEE